MKLTPKLLMVIGLALAGSAVLYRRLVELRARQVDSEVLLSSVDERLDSLERQLQARIAAES